MSNDEVVPFSEINLSKIDLNLAVEQGQKITETLGKMSIKEATFVSNQYYRHDESSNTTTLVANGILLQKNEHTTTIIVRNEGSTEEQALQELSTSPMTQKTLGAFSGISQQKTSELLLNKDE